MKFNKKILHLLQGIGLAVCLCFVLISYVPAEASDYNMSFTTVNIGELKPPVSEECLKKMGYPIQDFDFLIIANANILLSLNHILNLIGNRVAWRDDM